MKEKSGLFDRVGSVGNHDSVRGTFSPDLSNRMAEFEPIARCQGVRAQTPERHLRNRRDMVDLWYASAEFSIGQSLPSFVVPS
jgi:hypothetical protein